MISTGEVHTMLAEAERFARNGDPMGATRRARDAVAQGPDEASREEAKLAVDRCEAIARLWQASNARRHGEHVADELRRA